LEGERRSLIGKIFLMIGMVKIVKKIRPGRIIRGPREIRVISYRDYKSTSKDCVATLSWLHSCVSAVLDESEKWDSLRKHGLVPDNMNNPDYELVVS